MAWKARAARFRARDDPRRSTHPGRNRRAGGRARRAPSAAPNPPGLRRPSRQAMASDDLSSASTLCLRATGDRPKPPLAAAIGVPLGGEAALLAMREFV